MTVSETSRHTSIEILAGHRAAVHWYPALLSAFPAPEDQRKIVALMDAELSKFESLLLYGRYSDVGTKEIVWEPYYLKGTRHLIVDVTLWEGGEEGKKIVLTEEEMVFLKWLAETNREPNGQDRDTETVNREFNEWLAAQEEDQ